MLYNGLMMINTPDISLAHPVNPKSGEIVHSWKIGNNVIRENMDDDGYFLGTCIIPNCNAVRTWPAVIFDEKMIASKKRLNAFSNGEDDWNESAV